jgi:hypothetical protein
MSRFALHRQGQNCHVCPRWHDMACRGSRNYRSQHRARTTRLGYRREGSNVQPSTDRAKGFLPARSDQLSTLVTHGGCAATGKDEDAPSMTTSPSISPGYFPSRRNPMVSGIPFGGACARSSRHARHLRDRALTALGAPGDR